MAKKSYGSRPYDHSCWPLGIAKAGGDFKTLALLLASRFVDSLDLPSHPYDGDLK